MKHRIQDLGNKNLIGAKIVNIREMKGINQGKFLTMLHLAGMCISATSLSRLEGQHRLISELELRVIVQVLDVDVKDLLGLL